MVHLLSDAAEAQLKATALNPQLSLGLSVFR